MNKQELAEQIAKKHISKTCWNEYFNRHVKESVLAAIVEAMNVASADNSSNTSGDAPFRDGNSVEQEAQAYAERVCNGRFPVTYEREQVVFHTANDFKTGWNACLEKFITEDQKEFADLYKELAILEKQSKERYQKMIQDLEAAVQYGRDSINEMAKQISRQNDLIVSLEAQIEQDEHVKNGLRKDLMDFKDECNRLEGLVRHWQMKSFEGREGAVPPKIDNL